MTSHSSNLKTRFTTTDKTKMVNGPCNHYSKQYLQVTSTVSGKDLDEGACSSTREEQKTDAANAVK